MTTLNAKITMHFKAIRQPEEILKLQKVHSSIKEQLSIPLYLGLCVNYRLVFQQMTVTIASAERSDILLA